jgi:hypothetical protein
MWHQWQLINNGVIRKKASSCKEAAKSGGGEKRCLKAETVARKRLKAPAAAAAKLNVNENGWLA